MKGLLHKKGTKFYCSHCLDLVFVVKKDIFSCDKFSIKQIYQDRGQAPWKSHEKLYCRSCCEPLNPNNLITTGGWVDINKNTREIKSMLEG